MEKILVKPSLIKHKMKKITLTLLLLVGLVSLYFFWRFEIVYSKLSTYYTNISMLDSSKEIDTNNTRKDGAYNLLYVHSAESILSYRQDVIGKHASEILEKRGHRFAALRIAAENYLKKIGKNNRINLH